MTFSMVVSNNYSCIVSSDSKLTMNFCSYLFLVEYDTIVVDVDRPERNREVIVVKFTDVEKDGVLHDGFDILLEGDLRDFEGELYSAKIVGDNKILLTIPSANFSYLHDFDEFFTKLKDTEKCLRTVVAHQVARNSILGEKTRLCKHLLLQFPDGLVLSNRHYPPEDSNIDGELKTDFVRYAKTFTLQTVDLTNVVTTIFWKVSVVEEGQRMVKRSVGTKKRHEATITGRLGSMTI